MLTTEIYMKGNEKYWRDNGLNRYLESIGCDNPDAFGYVMNEFYYSKPCALIAYRQKAKWFQMQSDTVDRYRNYMLWYGKKTSIPVFEVFYDVYTINAWHVQPINQIAKSFTSENDMDLRAFVELQYKIRNIATPIDIEQKTNFVIADAKEIQSEAMKTESFRDWEYAWASVAHRVFGKENCACDIDLVLPDKTILEFKKTDDDHNWRTLRPKSAQIALARKAGCKCYLIKYNKEHTKFVICSESKTNVCTERQLKEFLACHGVEVIW